MNHCCYCFDGLWKVKVNARGGSCHLVLMDNCPTCSHMPWPYQATKWLAISSYQVVCGAWDSVALREVPLEKKVDMKCMQVNLLNNISRMTTRLYVLIMPHTRFILNLHFVVAWMSRTSCSKHTRYLKFKWRQRDSNPQSHLS